MSRLRSVSWIIGLVCISSLLTTNLLYAGTLEKISIVVFGPPSLGAFLPQVIKHLKSDEANGLSITFEERTPDAYTAAFNSGEFEIGGSASLLLVGLADIRGVKVSYLFNLFDFWGTVVTSREEVRSLKDLEGKELAAARGTTNYTMFEWFARQQGVDVAKISVVNTATPGLVGYALADRAAAVQLWEPAYTILLAKKPSIRTLDLKIGEFWTAYSGHRNIPYLGIAAHRSWIEKNPNLVPKLYATYLTAAQWVSLHPDEAAQVINPKAPPGDREALAALIRTNQRLGLNVRWASDVKNEIAAVYRAGQSVGFLSGNPSDSTIFNGPRK